MLSSNKTSLVGDACKPEATNLIRSSSLYAIPEPAPPIVKDGLTTNG